MALKAKYEGNPMSKILIYKWFDPLEAGGAYFYVFMYNVKFHLNGEDIMTKL